tara:strand:+ start:212 stop:451 length:240 start_codon:yes stop_codon:yes gene_type:complete
VTVAPRAAQPVRNLFLEQRVRGQPDGIGITCLFQPFIDRQDRVGGIRPKEPPSKVATSVARNNGVENIPMRINILGSNA